MRTARFLLAAVALVVAGTVDANAQNLLDRVGRAAGRAAERAIERQAERRTEDAVNNTIDGIFDGNDQQQQQAPQQQQGQTQQGNAPATVPTGVPADAGQQAPAAQTPQQGGTLVLPEGEVWLKNTSDSNKNGYIFHADATYNSFNNYDGETIGEWVIVTDNEYRVSGDKLTIYSATGAIWTYTYTISGNTLTLDFLGSIETYTRTAGINPTDNVY